MCFAEIATHNHFAFERGGKVFTQTGPIIQLPTDSTELEHFRLLAVLNSSTACFYLKQVCRNKGSTVDEHGARQRTAAFEDFYAFNGTKLANYPIPPHQPTQLPTSIVQSSAAMQAQTPSAMLTAWSGPESGDLRPRLASAREAWMGYRHQLIAWQEELDWQIYAAYGLITADDQLLWPEERMEELPPLELGQRTFEILMAQRMADGALQTTWFERHASAGSRPITEPPAHWSSDYTALYHRRHTALQENSNLRLIEQPEYKRRWNTEPWEKQLDQALRQWLLARLETAFYKGERMAEASANCLPANLRNTFPAGREPRLCSTRQLADVVSHDPAFMQAAAVYRDREDFDLHALVQELVEAESVPYLPLQRYKDSGLRKRAIWERTWDLQREEDRIDALIVSLKKQIEDRIVSKLKIQHPDLVVELESKKAALDAMDREYHETFYPAKEYNPEKPHYDDGIPNVRGEQMLAYLKLSQANSAWIDIKMKVDSARLEIELADETIPALRQELEAVPAKPEIAVPPKYASTDFKKAYWWKLRGKLDVPKERCIIYPNPGDTSPTIAWAGWNHQQQAQALASYYTERKDQHGWSKERLAPLLAGLKDLLPWLKQWHNDLDPHFQLRLGDFYNNFVRDETHALGMNEVQIEELRMGGIV